MTKLPIVIAITGASGAIHAVRLLHKLKELDEPTVLIISKLGAFTIKHETGMTLKYVKSLATECFNNDVLMAPCASGTYQTKGMVVIPCSSKTLSGIANSYDDNLVIRSASVTLKERRKLILMFRETPLSSIHIQLMLKATNSGAIVMPPTPSYYLLPKSIDDIIDGIVFKILDLFDITHPLAKRWDHNMAND